MKWKIIAYLRLCRIQNIYLAFLDALCVYITCKSYLNPNSRLDHFIAIIIFSSMLWISGVILNDIVDRNKDKYIHPDKPLVKNQISVDNAYILAIGLQVFCIYLVIYIANCFSFALFFILLLIIAIYAYNFFTKNKKLLGCITMGFARALNCIYPLHLLGCDWNYIYFAIKKDTYSPFTFYIFFFIAYITYLSYYENITFSRIKLFILHLPLVVISFVFYFYSSHYFSYGGNYLMLDYYYAYPFLMLIPILSTLLGVHVLFLIPALLKKKIDVLGLLHLYIMNSILISYYIFRHRFYPKETMMFLIFFLPVIYYLRITLKGIFRES